MIITETLQLPTLEVVKSDTFFETYSVFNEDDEPVDLSVYGVIKMDIRTGLTENSKLIHSSTLANGDIIISGDYNEIITIKIEPSETQNWNPGMYHRDIRFIIEGYEGRTQTLLRGKINVINNITSI